MRPKQMDVVVASEQAADKMADMLGRAEMVLRCQAHVVKPGQVIFVTERDQIDPEGAPPRVRAQLALMKPGEPWVEVVAAENAVALLSGEPAIAHDMPRLARMIRMPAPAGSVRIVAVAGALAGSFCAEVKPLDPITKGVLS